MQVQSLRLVCMLNFLKLQWYLLNSEIFSFFISPCIWSCFHVINTLCKGKQSVYPDDFLHFLATHGRPFQPPKPMQSGTKEMQPSYVPNYLPPFPDPHTYVKTLVSHLFKVTCKSQFEWLNCKPKAIIIWQHYEIEQEAYSEGKTSWANDWAIH